MEPLIRNFKSVLDPESGGAQLIGVEDNPPTCTMGYTEIQDGKTSAHHIHPWEHEIFVIGGAGTLICDGKEYPIKEGDALFIPGEVDHCTLNDGGQGPVRRIEINPISASLGDIRSDGGTGTGQPPVIRNYRDLDRDTGSRIIGSSDGAPNYLMLYNGAMAPGEVSHAETGGHTHAWDHVVFVLEGQAIIVCDGKEYAVSEGDGVLVSPETFHQWRNNSQSPMTRVSCNPLSSEGTGG